jgi:hypothetical protein
MKTWLVRLLEHYIYAEVIEGVTHLVSAGVHGIFGGGLVLALILAAALLMFVVGWIGASIYLAWQHERSNRSRDAQLRRLKKIVRNYSKSANVG